MNPYSRMMWTLLAALLIWSPVALLTIQGEMDLTGSGVYFLGALTIAYLSVGIIGHLTQGYRDTANKVELAKQQIEEIERRRAEADAQEHSRRKDDV